MKALRLVTAVLLALLVPSCAIVIDVRDGTARIQGCPGVEFTIIVEQGPHQPTARTHTSQGVLHFSADAFRDIDFSKQVTVTVFASTVPPGSECPIKAGVKYKLTNTILPPVPGESRKYEADLSKFKETP
jgi:hypothetical protein